jgi:opacity protein-like surface antigen
MPAAETNLQVGTNASRMLKTRGERMKRSLIVAILLAAAIAGPAVLSAGPVYKEKKYFGPIPWNGFSLSFGFYDGANIDNLTEYLDKYAKDRNGYETFEDLGNAPFARIGYERQITPNHFLRFSTCFTYITTSSIGAFVDTYPDPARPDTLVNFDLSVERTFKAYIISMEAGFLYYFVAPEVQRFSPYTGGGFAAVAPLVRLETDARYHGEPFDPASLDFSKNSVQAGLHLEFGMNYYLTNRYAAAIEGRYQMAQSKLRVYRGNFDLDYSGFSLAIVLSYLL